MVVELVYIDVLALNTINKYIKAVSHMLISLWHKA